jgi:hypothetical protein
MNCHHLASYDMALSHTCNALEGQQPNVCGGTGHAQPVDGSDNNEETDKVPALVSFDLLACEAAVLKYWTGLRPGAQRWVWKQLRRVVWKSCVFVILSLRLLGLYFEGVFIIFWTILHR